MVDPNDSTIILAATTRACSARPTRRDFSLVHRHRPAVAPHVVDQRRPASARSYCPSRPTTRQPGTTDGQVWTSADHGAPGRAPAAPASTGGAPPSPRRRRDRPRLRRWRRSRTTSPRPTSPTSTNPSTAADLDGARRLAAVREQNMESSRVDPRPGKVNQLSSSARPTPIRSLGRALLLATTDGGSTYRQSPTGLRSSPALRARRLRHTSTRRAACTSNRRWHRVHRRRHDVHRHVEPERHHPPLLSGGLVAGSTASDRRHAGRRHAPARGHHDLFDGRRR